MESIREKLVELLKGNEDIVRAWCGSYEDAADELIANGVTVQQAKVGDTVYQTDGVRIYESTVKKLIYDTGVIAFDEEAIGKSVFLTREEAEAKLSQPPKGE